MKNEVTGAGIICYFDNRENIIDSLDKDLLFLILEDFNRNFDLTKGTIDEGESSYNCAVRETFEESNLEIVDFEKISNTPINLNSNLEMFLGQIKTSSMENIDNIVKLKVNKTINAPEHSRYYFLNFEEAEKRLYKFLVPYLQKAYNDLY